LIATGIEERDKGRLRQYLDRVRRYLDVDVVDVFFAEYVTPSEDIAQIRAVLDELWDWKERGLIRYVGATTHNRAIAKRCCEAQIASDLIKSDRTEVLMHRYNVIAGVPSLLR
jgi:aryl-alcohol dehydrogenase-like predicted oxidoreductase